MSKFTMQGFYDFCKSKDEREKIDNKFWSTCALGLYMESIGEPFPKEKAGYFASELPIPPKFAEHLNDGDFSNFGEIVDYIDHHEVLSTFAKDIFNRVTKCLNIQNLQ